MAQSLDGQIRRSAAISLCCQALGLTIPPSVLAQAKQVSQESGDRRPA